MGARAIRLCRVSRYYSNSHIFKPITYHGHRSITTDFLTEQNIEEQKSRLPVRAFGLEKTSYLDIP